VESTAVRAPERGISSRSTPAGESSTKTRRRSGRPPFGASAVVVVVVGVLITTVFAVGARAVRDANENRLLRQRVREVGALLMSTFPTVQTPLSSAAVLAEATNGNAAAFRGLMQPIIAARRPFISSSIWDANGSSLRPLVVVGATPALESQPPEKVRAFLRRATGRPSMSLYDMLGASDRRLGYAMSVPSKHARFVVYGEASLPKNRRARIDKNSAFADLDYSLFIGARPQQDQLIASSTGGTLAHGRTASVRVPFGDSKLLVVMSPRGDLGGSLLARLWWLLVIIGLGLTAAAAALVERLSRRRHEAERLAQENEELYATQRSVALTLQHSLLTQDFPQVPGLEIGARYVAGAEGIDIGGDWYDVVRLDETRVMIAVGDVSGRGLPAATTMASLRFAIRAYAAQGDRPGIILTKLSDLLNLARDGHFATVLCATIDLHDRSMICANAGHPEPLTIAEDVAYVPTDIGLPVGVRRGVTYVERVSALPPAGTVLFYTDGLIERRGESLSDGLDRLARAAGQSTGSLEAVLSTVLDQTIPDGSADDTALLGMRWNL
jgi:serine phosphatase RsbU (regulator of sigma subunit)